jgi:hypothetical protein
MSEFEPKQPLKTDIDTKSGTTEPIPPPKKEVETFLQVVEKNRKELALHCGPPNPAFESEEFKKEWKKVFNGKHDTKKQMESELKIRTLRTTD